MALPSVLINVYLIAFGLNTELPYWMKRGLPLFFEVVYGLEIILSFLTAYIDPETNYCIVSIKQIALFYIKEGSFVSHFLAFLPWLIIIPENDDPERE
jgi:hypothetical protein